MKIYQVKALDCRELKNRKLLVKEIKKVVKQNTRPEVDFLERFAKSIGKRYRMPIQLMKQTHDCLFVSISYEPNVYSTYRCYSYYEAICKYILLVKAFKEFKELKPTK